MRNVCVTVSLSLGVALVVASIVVLNGVGRAASTDSGAPERVVASPATLSETFTYLPLVLRNYDSKVYPNCRFGVTGSLEQFSVFDITAQLNAGWYMDFWAHAPFDGAPAAEFFPLIFVTQDRGGSTVCGPDYGYHINGGLDSGLASLVAANPGLTWIIGNEPERLGQGDICPQQYAEAYHDAYYFIKQNDPTAQVAFAGLVQVTPARLQYLDIVWSTYLERYGETMPVDVWTMHAYVLSESDDGDANIPLGTDPALSIPFGFNCVDPNSFCHAEHSDIDLFVDQIVMMREWMKAHGQQDRPLLLTEFSLLKPYHYYGTCTVNVCPPEGVEGCFCDENRETFNPTRVANFMEDAFDYLMTAADPRLGYPRDDYRLVQRWMWYSLETYPPAAGHASNLMTADAGYVLTLQGRRWQSYVRDIPAQIDLAILDVPTAVAQTSAMSEPVTVTLAVEVLNTGNTLLNRTARVVFYSDAALTQPVAAATFSGLGGCASASTIVTATWPGLTVGTHPFWARIESAGNETDTSDNVGSGIAFVALARLYLPVVLSN
ncbi:MAG: hypothetical protein JXD18_10710 [Anaerolineae bacterium]|nr:hypothetical protein [Anaerolineae bacterium]